MCVTLVCVAPVHPLMFVSVGAGSAAGAGRGCARRGPGRAGTAAAEHRAATTSGGGALRVQAQVAGLPGRTATPGATRPEAAGQGITLDF